MAAPRDLLPAWLLDHHSTPPPPHVTVVPWDDGFTPSGCGGRAGRLVRDHHRASPGALRVVDGAVSRATADRLYASAVAARVWGVYVPVAQLFSDSEESEADREDDTDLQERERRALARDAVRELLVTNAAEVVSADDWKNAHGVAVWVIASDCDDETEYHLDYAELVRFETNVIVPPVYGATLHVSPLRNADVGCSAAGDESVPVAAKASEQPLDELPEFDGGAFFVNRRGLVHYEQYGYKTRRMAHKVSTDELETVSRSEDGWVRVPYVYRRGIICDGEFPHFSGRVRSLPTPAETQRAAAGAPTTEQPVKRVVVGFNVFPHEIGACVQKFPEHSSAFNKHVKLSQAAAKQLADASSSDASKQPQQTWSLESIRANPKQAAFLKFLAKKMKEKNLDLATLRGSRAAAERSAPVAPAPVAQAASTTTTTAAS